MRYSCGQFVECLFMNTALRWVSQGVGHIWWAGCTMWQVLWSQYCSISHLL